MVDEGTLAQALVSASRFDKLLNQALGSALTAAISATQERQEWIAYVGLLLVALRVQSRSDVIGNVCDWICNDFDAKDALATTQKRMEEKYARYVEENPPDEETQH